MVFCGDGRIPMAHGRGFISRDRLDVTIDREGHLHNFRGGNFYSSGESRGVFAVRGNRFFLDRREEFRGSEAKGIQGIERKTGLLWKLGLDRMCLDPLRALPCPFGQRFMRLVVHGRNHREVKMIMYG